MTPWRCLTLLLFISMTVCAAHLASPHDEPAAVGPFPPKATFAVAPGGPVADFTLRDVHGQEHSLSQFADRKAVVIVFVGCSCPLAQLYAPRLADLAREFTPQGVAFLAINSNSQDSLADMAAHARLHKLPFPLLKDPDQSVADALAVARTPEAIVLDGQRRIRYRGRVDDQYGIGVHRSGPERRDLAEALKELLADGPISQPATTVVGCFIGRSPKKKLQGDVTYAQHIAPILQKHCVECHRPGQIAPFPLIQLTDVAAWSAMIREVVEEGRMPPWSAAGPVGHFRNDPRLSAAEKQTLFCWIDNGCPPGNLADLAAPQKESSGWRIPAPDRVITMAEEPFQVPAEGEVRYQFFVVDPGFTEDKYVQAAEVRPGNRSVVHHALVSIMPPGSHDMQRDTSGALLLYTPGVPPLALPDGLAIHVPAGSKFVFQLHYTPNGLPQEDRTCLGLVFADPAVVKKHVFGGQIANEAIDIPAGAANHREQAEQIIPDDIVLLSMTPHLHLRGKAFRYEAVFADGRSELLLDVPRYDFNWQHRYDLAVPRPLPRGTRLVCTAWYDNSANNPANPDPSQRVTWGDQTWQEMLVGFYSYLRT